MTQCVVDTGTGFAASASSPCPGFVLLTETEYQTVLASPWNMTAEDGMTLSVAILGVWAVAFSIRALVRALNVDGEVNE